MNYDEKLKNKLYQSNGQAFQSLFYKIMGATYSDFIPVKAVGASGDSGCDGYLSNSGTYYQVYGPEKPYLEQTQSNAVSKIGYDFKKLYTNLQGNPSFPVIQSYIFVLNNKTIEAISMAASAKINELREQYHAINFNLLTNEGLLNLFSNLSINVKNNILDNYTDTLDNQEFIKQIRYQNLQYDLTELRKIKESANKLAYALSLEDFCSPFIVTLISQIEGFRDNLESITFNDNESIMFKNNCVEKSTILLNLIMYYTRPTGNPLFGVMKRIGNDGEIQDEEFEDVRDKMVEARDGAYYSIERLNNVELFLISELQK